MGTNYYVVPNRPSILEPVHLGKSSAGWMFLFHAQCETWRDIPIIWTNYEEVKMWLYTYTVASTDYVIMDEYDNIVSFEDFVNMVRWSQEHCKDHPDNFKYNDNVNGYRFTEGDFC